MKPIAWICATCGVQYEPSPRPPANCIICEDERQYVAPTGQAWTTLTELRAARHNLIESLEPGLCSIRTEPAFAIGQRAYLVSTEEGNLLWDCVGLIDDQTVREVRELGGIRAIAISHPHYYSTMTEWSAAFGSAPVWIHRADARWIPKTSANVHLWEGTRCELFAGLTLVHCGGHFDGYQVAYWPAGAEGAGVLLAGDQPQVCLDSRWVTFMYSYPNWIPLGATAVQDITERLLPLPFDRMYGAFGRNLNSGAREVIARSEVRYRKAITS